MKITNVFADVSCVIAGNKANPKKKKIVVKYRLFKYVIIFLREFNVATKLS